MARPIGYAGYYPGDEIPRPIRGGRPTPYIPNEYDLNAFNEAIGDMAHNFGDVPGWVAKQLDADLSASFKAIVYAKHLSAEDRQGYTSEEFGEEQGELAGMAGLGITLDPRVIAKDPKKWALGIPNDIWKQMINVKDMETSIRGNVWTSITGLAETRNSRLIKDLQTTVVFTHAKEGTSRASLTSAERGPLEIGHITAIDENGKVKKIGEKTAQEIVDFESDILTAVYRSGNFDKVMGTTLDGTSTILREEIMGDALVNGPQGNDASIAGAFILKAGFAKRVGSLGFVATDDPKASAVRLLERYRDEVAPKIKVGGQLVDLNPTHAISGIQNEINRSRAYITLMTGGLGALSQEQRGSLRHEVALYEKMAGLGPDGKIREIRILDPKELQELMPKIQKYEKALGNLEKAIAGADPQSALGVSDLIRKINTAAMPLTGGLELSGEHSIHRGLLRGITNRDFIGGNLEDIVRNPEHREFIRKTQTMLLTLERDRRFRALDDTMDAFYSDKALVQLLWKAQISPRLKAFTPDYLLTTFMTRMHYFGLVIKEHTLLDAYGNEINPKFFLFKLANKVTRSNKAFHNTFNIDFEGVGKVAIRGSHKLAAVGGLIKIKDADKALLRKFLEAANAGAIESFLKEAGIKDKLLEIFGDEKGLTEFLEKFEKFYGWLKENATKLGFDINNVEKVTSLINALNKYDIDKIKNLGIGITREFRGVLENLTQKLNILQNQIFKGVIGKIAGTIIGWKMVLSHAISVAITAAITALTGGATSFVAGVLEKVIQVITRVFLDVAEKIVMSILKADFNELHKYIEKSLYNLLKFFAYALGVILIVAALCMLPMMVILGAFSPQDNSKLGGINSSEVAPGEAAPDLDPIEPGGCFFMTGGYLSYPSFGNGSVDGCAGYALRGHGGTAYTAAAGCINNPWKLQPSYAWPGCSESACSSQYGSTTSTHFGYAADFTSATNPLVYLPTLGQPDVAGGNNVWIWDVMETGNISVGGWVTVSRTDSAGDLYILHILHITTNQAVRDAAGSSTTMLAGDNIGTLYTGLSTGLHVHIELMVNGVVRRPDSVFCQ